MSLRGRETTEAISYIIDIIEITTPDQSPGQAQRKELPAMTTEDLYIFSTFK